MADDNFDPFGGPGYGHTMGGNKFGQIGPSGSVRRRRRLEDVVRGQGDTTREAGLLKDQLARMDRHIERQINQMAQQRHELIQRIRSLDPTFEPDLTPHRIEVKVSRENEAHIQVPLTQPQEGEVDNPGEAHQEADSDQVMSHPSDAKPLEPASNAEGPAEEKPKKPKKQAESEPAKE